MKFTETKQARQAAEMCRLTLTARAYSRMGQIIGEPGTGKSATTLWLADELKGIRVECWCDITPKGLLTELARGLCDRGVDAPLRGTCAGLMAALNRVCVGRLILIDEANHLNWHALELLRALSDIGGAGVVLVGTDMLAQRLNEARTRVYLTQLRQRIGAKKIMMAPIDDAAEMAAYVLAPRFGRVGQQAAKRFLVATKGYWRSALELADACERLIKNEESLTALDERAVDTAAALMAGAK
ncbi:MAG: ATP-binding protein [Hyphomicrobiales bacterium]